MALPRNPVSTQGYTTLAADKVTITTAVTIAAISAALNSLDTAQRVTIQADPLSTSSVAVGSSVQQPYLISIGAAYDLVISRFDRVSIKAGSGTAIANLVALG